MNESPTYELASFVVEASFNDLPVQVVEKTKLTCPPKTIPDIMS